jgi:micrococcal nuclease
MSGRKRAPKRQPLPPFLRRRSTLWLFGALILLGVAAILNAVSRHGSGPHAVETPTSQSTATSVAVTPYATPLATPGPTPAVSAATQPPVADALDIHPDPARLERASVVRVIDGDTIVVELNGQEEHVRYYGIDTPEVGQACYDEATQRNEELIDGTVLLLPDARNRDRYGRLLRYVFDERDHSVDERLIAEGYAHAWREDGAYRDQLVALEDETHAASTGCLWK